MCAGSPCAETNIFPHLAHHTWESMGAMGIGAATGIGAMGAPGGFGQGFGATGVP